MRPGVYLGWHVHPFEELLALVRQCEALGWDAAFVDGDVSLLAKRPRDDCLDGWTATVALIQATTRIGVGSMRLVHHWNAARLAQAVATVERIAPGRLRFQIAIGDWAADARFGLPVPGAGERIRWLDETLGALRALWRGETVSCAGRHVELSEAFVRPAPPGGIEVCVAARRPRMLEQVARHADLWDVNLPAVPALVGEAQARLEAACARHGRDPAAIGRSMLLFTRVQASEAEALVQFRRFNPWFAAHPDAQVAPALVSGEPGRCRERLRELADALALERPVVDLSGLPGDAARRALERLGPPDFLR